MTADRRWDPVPARDRRALAAVGLTLLVVLAGCAAVLGGPGGDDITIPDDASDEPVENALQFRTVTDEVGLDYETTSEGQFGDKRAGVFVADYDGDGWQDLLAVGGDDPALFRNANGTFERTGALPSIEQPVKSALFFDHDADGDQDLLLLPLNHSAVLLENRPAGDGTAGERTFVRVDAGFDARIEIPHGAAAADFDRDGCLDVFVYASGDWRGDVPQRQRVYGRTRHGETPADDVVVRRDNGGRNRLYRGTCGDGFENVTAAAGLGVERHWSLAASFVDVNRDGLPDVHVANDFYPNRVHINQGDGTFSAQKISYTNRHGMSSEVEDVDGDGLYDVFVTNVHFQPLIQNQRVIPAMDNSGNNMIINEGDGTFYTAEEQYGLKDGGWGWAAAMVDLDNDGDQDLVHATRSYLNRSNRQTTVVPPPRLWDRTGANFTRLDSAAHGLPETNGRGLAHLDFDRDGDQDLVVADLNGGFEVLENRVDGHNWLQVSVERDGRQALGADVTVSADNETLRKAYISQADLFSQDTRVLHWGVGNATRANVTVTMPDGGVRSFEDVPVNRHVLVRNDTWTTVSLDSDAE